MIVQVLFPRLILSARDREHCIGWSTSVRQACCNELNQLGGYGRVDPHRCACLKKQLLEINGR